MHIGGYEGSVKLLPQDEICFTYLITKLLELAEQRLKEGAFVKPDIRRHIRLIRNTSQPKRILQKKRKI